MTSINVHSGLIEVVSVLCQNQIRQKSRNTSLMHIFIQTTALLATMQKISVCVEMSFLEESRGHVPM